MAFLSMTRRESGQAHGKANVFISTQKPKKKDREDWFLETEKTFRGNTKFLQCTCGRNQHGPQSHRRAVWAGPSLCTMLLLALSLMDIFRATKAQTGNRYFTHLTLVYAVRDNGKGACVSNTIICRSHGTSLNLRLCFTVMLRLWISEARLKNSRLDLTTHDLATEISDT